MMKRTAQFVLLCEDVQHEAFLRRFLDAMGQTKKSQRRIRVERAPKGRGSAEQFVRGRFPRELAEYRRRKKRVSSVLVVMLDGDDAGRAARLDELDAACAAQQVAPGRRSDGAVFVFVPTWNVETWFAYLDGETVDESRPDYPRLARERDCRRHVDALALMCRKGQLREPAPPALTAACTEYGRWNRG